VCLRRSKGLSWPLYDTTGVSGYILDELNNETFENLPNTLDRYNFSKIFFRLPENINTISSAIPEMFNIKLITTDIVNDNINTIQFKLENGEFIT
jgi:hypothetical protein